MQKELVNTLVLKEIRVQELYKGPDNTKNCRFTEKNSGCCLFSNNYGE